MSRSSVTNFADDDAKQMRKIHLEEMKRFSSRIVLGNVPGSSFDNDDDYINITIDLDLIRHFKQVLHRKCICEMCSL